MANREFESRALAAAVTAGTKGLMFGRLERKALELSEHSMVAPQEVRDSSHGDQGNLGMWPGSEICRIGAVIISAPARGVVGMEVGR